MVSGAFHVQRVRLLAPQITYIILQAPTERMNEKPNFNGSKGKIKAPGGLLIQYLKGPAS